MHTYLYMSTNICGLTQWLSNKESPAMQETLETWIQSLGQEDLLEEATATHSNILAWRIPWTEEPGGLQSMGLQRVEYNWSDQWRRQWHPTPVLLPGKSLGWRNLVGYSPWGRKESDTTGRLSTISPFGGSDSEESPCNEETQVQSLCWEDPLETGMATHSTLLDWRFPWTEKPGGLQSMGLQRVGHNWGTNSFFPPWKEKKI